MRRFEGVVWAFAVAVVLLTLAGCDGGNVTGPSPVDSPTAQQEPVSAPLRTPDRLRLVWGTMDTAAGPVVRFGANAVALQIGTWGEDVTPFARWARERGLVVFPFVEQVFTASDWPYYWAKVEAWAKPLAPPTIVRRARGKGVRSRVAGWQAGSTFFLKGR